MYYVALLDAQTTAIKLTNLLANARKIYTQNSKIGLFKIMLIIIITAYSKLVKVLRIGNVSPVISECL